MPSHKRKRADPFLVSEIDLHGLTVDEALPRVDEFIKSAFRAGYVQIRVVHGKGSGILRQEVDRFLAGHPLVSFHQLADKYHGGDGATQVVLNNR